MSRLTALLLQQRSVVVVLTVITPYPGAGPVSARANAWASSILSERIQST